MKYLKTYEEVIQPIGISDEIFQTIKDICLDLEDEEFSITCLSSSNFQAITNMDPDSREKTKSIRDKLVGYVSITKQNNGLQEFTLSEIIDTVNRIKTYLGDRFYYSMSVTPGSGDPFRLSGKARLINLEAQYWYNTKSLPEDTKILKTLIIFNI